ncbi:hypothetical protein GCM10022631_17540 [Deinococcus rubellus]|uniref:FKBP-type peptidyl-prolyl cis-trans isomerase n=1 Tax=Deinococcus rubellus TaxID=1889240 RepID=UPI0031F1102A
MPETVNTTSVAKLTHQEREELLQVTVLMGHTDGLPAGLEAALLGRAVGERFVVEVSGPAFDIGLVQSIPLTELPAGTPLGALLYAADDTGQPRSYRVTKLGDHIAELDANPEDAGQQRHFEVEVLTVRAATPEELAHRHVHGEGGHRH